MSQQASPAGEERYPGTLNSRVTYLLTADSTVYLQYEASTDAATHVNLTQHTYFNLAGEHSTSVLDHELTIHGSRYAPVDPVLIPIGTTAAVQGTPFDFQRPRCIGEALPRRDDQLLRGRGFNHNWVL
jgi:aldose 1-epimerase